MAMDYLVLLACWCFFAVVGYLIGAAKGNAGTGAVWGFLLGPIGWLIVAVSKDKRKKCPYCGGTLGDGRVTRCRNCGQSLVRISVASPVIDPIEAWNVNAEAKERAAQVLAVPEHLKGKKVDDE